MDNRKRIVIKREGVVIEDFQARDCDFEAKPAYVVTGRRRQVPSVQAEDRLYVNGRVGGEVVAVVPARLGDCWEIHFTPTEAFLRSLQPRSRRRMKAQAGEAGAGEAEADEAGTPPFPAFIEKPQADATEGAGAVPEDEGDGNGNG